MDRKIPRYGPVTQMSNRNGRLQMKKNFIRIAALLVAIVAQASPPALAQGLPDCESGATACLTGCEAVGAFGVLLGNGGRNVALVQCRTACEQTRGQCQQQRTATAPSPARPAQELAQPPAPTNTVAGAEAAGRTPTATAAANGESVVLLTVKSKPLSTRSPVFYVEQALSQSEARQHMRPSWSGPVPVNNPGEAGLALAIYGHPTMTRSKLVDSTLAAYERSGGRRSDIRIDVLSTAPRAATPAVVTSPKAASPATTQGAVRAYPVSEISPLAKKYHCSGCHRVEGKHLGRSFHDIAVKYRAGGAPAETLFAYLTSGSPKEGMAWSGAHHIPKNDEVRRLVEWVLAQ